MLFFKIEGVINDNSIIEKLDSRKSTFELVRELGKTAEEFNNKNHGIGFFISEMKESHISVGAVCDANNDIDSSTEELCKALNTDITIIRISEVTFKTLRTMINTSCRNDFIEDDDDVIEKYGLSVLDRRGIRGSEFGENLVKSKTKKSILDMAKKYLLEETLMPEINRIYAGRSKTKAKGHPVHYMVMSDDHDTRNDTYKSVLSALLENKRIDSKRYIYMDLRPGDPLSLFTIRGLYNTSVGGAVVIRYVANNEAEDDYASSERDVIERICEVITEHKNDVLTIICLPRECTKPKGVFYENLGGMSFIELKEDMAKGDVAKTYLKYLAKNDHIRTDTDLFEKIEEGLSYLPSELKVFYDDWYNEKLRKSVYPQYKDCKSARRKAAKKSAIGSAYDSLQEMIGLTEAKAVIQKALNYYKVQQIYKNQGISSNHPAMHMVFTGNPGTAKTTVARLFARIMKENGLLSKGHLVEVGRGDLVGKYVGWTAQIVQKKFQEAKGGVLFIDEAYSLVDDRDGSFGDEAINTIVQEMENHRDELVVIFAGYPDKMEEFLNKNPGLRSRIAFHVPFADYNADELCMIADLMGEQHKVSFTDEAKKKLHEIFDDAKNREGFGNGRYVRNVLEMAQMNQAGRILQMDADKVSKKDITTITDSDIEAPCIGDVKVKRPIGFCA